jgi:hypothetical protein
MKPAARSGLAALLVALSHEPAANDVCSAALDPYATQCADPGACEQCGAESIARIMAHDPEGAAWMAERAAGDVAHQLAAEGGA